MDPRPAHPDEIPRPERREGSLPQKKQDAAVDGWSTAAHVRRWQAGDEAAFDALYRRYAPIVAHRVRTSRVWPLLRGYMEVDDAVNIVWARLVPAARRSFEPTGPGSFLAFLGKLADRTLISEARREHAAKRGDGDRGQSIDAVPADVWEPGNGGAGIETPTSRARVSEIMELAARLLNEDERVVWERRTYDGYDYDEIAVAIRRTAAAARSIHLRAKRKLATAIGDGDCRGDGDGREPPARDVET